MKKPELILRIRSYASGQSDVWLIESVGGGAEQCRLYGQMPPAAATALAERLAPAGVATEREERT